MKFQRRVRQTFYNNLESGKRAFNSLLSEAHMTAHKCQTTRSLHPCDFDSSIFLASRIGFITSHRSGRAVTFRCQSRAIDTLSASQFKTAFPRSSESFRLSISISPPVGVAFYADVPVGDYRICQSQSTRHPALHGPASIHEGIFIAANYILLPRRKH
jgi:hypothetical protein